jgi:hypothetical protein
MILFATFYFSIFRVCLTLLNPSLNLLIAALFIRKNNTKPILLVLISTVFAFYFRINFLNRYKAVLRQMLEYKAKWSTVFTRVF